MNAKQPPASTTAAMPASAPGGPAQPATPAEQGCTGAAPPASAPAGLKLPATQTAAAAMAAPAPGSPVPPAAHAATSGAAAPQAASAAQVAADAAVPPGPAAPAAPPGATGPAGDTPQPTTPASIETLADSLSSSTDELHEAIMRALRRRERDPDHGVTQDAVQALFEQEVALRQSANHLYVDAATLAAAGLGDARQALMDVTAAARDQLKRAARLQDLAALAAGLAALGGAIAAGKPSQLPAAVKNVRNSIAALHGAKQA